MGGAKPQGGQHMFLELIATIVAGIAAAGLMMVITRASGGRLPKWLTPVAAGAAMIAATIANEYGWYGRTADNLPEDFVIVEPLKARRSTGPGPTCILSSTVSPPLIRNRFNATKTPRHATGRYLLFRALVSGEQTQHAGRLRCEPPRGPHRRRDAEYRRHGKRRSMAHGAAG